MSEKNQIRLYTHDWQVVQFLIQHCWLQENILNPSQCWKWSLLFSHWNYGPRQHARPYAAAYSA